MNPTLVRTAAALLALLGTSRAQAADAKLTPGAGSAVFGENPKLACKGAAFDELDDALKQEVKKAKHELLADGRLCAAATALLAYDPKASDTPPPHVIAFLSSHYGLARPARRAVVMDLDMSGLGITRERNATADEARAVAETLQESLGKILSAYEQPRWGMATSRLSKTTTRVAVVFDDRALELADVPRRLDPGQKAVVAGKVLPPYRNPRLAVSDVKGQVTRPEPAPGDAFSAPVECGSAAGDLWVELQAEKDGKPAPVTTFAIACGKPLPTSVSLAAEPWPADLGAQAHKLADGVNAQREAAGLAKVEWDEKVAEVARDLATQYRDQMAKGDTAGVAVEPLLEKAGVASALVVVNPAQAPTAAEAEARFAASPTNRANMLNPEVNRVGVGVITTTLAGKPAVFVVELFTQYVDKIDPGKVQADLYAEVEKRRAAAGAPVANPDPKLEKVAKEYALALAESGGKLSADVADDVTHAIRVTYKSIDLIEGAKPNPLDFAGEAVASKGTSLGIGVAQGDSPALGKNAVFVAVIIATPRDTKAAEPAKAPAKGKKK